MAIGIVGDNPVTEYGQRHALFRQKVCEAYADGKGYTRVEQWITFVGDLTTMGLGTGTLTLPQCSGPDTVINAVFGGVFEAKDSAGNSTKAYPYNFCPSLSTSGFHYTPAGGGGGD